MLASGCDRAPQAAVSAGAQPAKDVVPHSREADDTGRFLAGMPAKDGSPFVKLQETDAWKAHRRVLDIAWANAEGGLIQNLKEFQQRELGDPGLGASPVFYPFSGPDTLTMTLLFPNNSTYVMVGLEPAGTLPPFKKLAGKNLPAYFNSVRGTMDSELRRSFFITRQMDRQFRGQVTDGLLVPILHLLLRTGNQILGFRYIRLDDSGAVIDRSPDWHAVGRIGNKGVEIEFQSSGSGSVRKLYYFSVNLSDERLRENPAFMKYLARLNGATTLLKATSYMTHRPAFSMIRQQIVGLSGAVLQDDSGIPYKDFASGAWKVQLYGSYTRPYGSFRWLEQPDLKKAYQTQGPKELTLRIGYGYSKVPSNLLFGRKGL